MCGLFRLNQDSFHSIFQSAWVKKILLVFETKFHFREYDMYKWRHWTLLVKPFRFHFPRKKSCTKKMECDSRDMFLSWKNKQNVKVGLWKWKCTHIKKWWRPEFLPFFVMPDRRVDFKIQTSVLLCKVFFGRLTINLLVTKSEEFWSCDKKNQNMRWWPQSLGDKRKRQKRKWWLPGWFFFSSPCCCQQPGVDPSRLATAQKVKYFQWLFI